MTQSSFNIEGITCNGCVAKLTNLFKGVDGVEAVNISKETGQVKLQASTVISSSVVSQVIKPYPKYQLVESTSTEASQYSFKPLVMIIGFILLVVILSQINRGSFNLMESMRLFMGGFFICFSFFKLLDLDGYATAYQSYDIIAAKWKVWGFIYAFIELGLGIAYILNFQPIATNILTIIIMGISSIGVIKAVSSNQKIQCACLGTGFNLPMTTVTIVEDVGMLLMAGIMLLSYL